MTGVGNISPERQRQTGKEVAELGRINKSRIESLMSFEAVSSSNINQSQLSQEQSDYISDLKLNGSGKITKALNHFD